MLPVPSNLCPRRFTRPSFFNQKHMDFSLFSSKGRILLPLGKFLGIMMYAKSSSVSVCMGSSAGVQPNGVLQFPGIPFCDDLLRQGGARFSKILKIRSFSLLIFTDFCSTTHRLLKKNYKHYGHLQAAARASGFTRREIIPGRCEN